MMSPSLIATSNAATAAATVDEYKLSPPITIALDKTKKESAPPKAKVQKMDPVAVNSAIVDSAIRPPTYEELELADWERSLAWRDGDFAYDAKQHPHIRRRKTILQRHPHIRRLFGQDTMTFWTILLCVVNHFLVAHLVSKLGGWWSWPVLIVAACAIGGSIVDLLAVCIHECCHGTVAKTPLANKLLGLFCNLGTVIPIAMGFRRYHSDHHVYQGSATKDPDMPLAWEIPLIRGTIGHKLIWLTAYPAMYAVRAMVRGKNVHKWERINLVFTLFCNLLYWGIWGWRGFIYFVISFAYGYTFHPTAAHFLQEHYTFANGQETYNYYGWANMLFLNIGFHNEHHDFPVIPARYLPLVTKIAPEFYLPLLCHKSWRRVLWAFLTDQNIGPQSRCAREEQIRVRNGQFVSLTTDS